MLMGLKCHLNALSVNHLGNKYPDYALLAASSRAA